MGSLHGIKGSASTQTPLLLFFKSSTFRISSPRLWIIYSFGGKKNNEWINQELSIGLPVPHLKEKSTRMEKGEEGEVSVKKVKTLNRSADSPDSQSAFFFLTPLHVHVYNMEPLNKCLESGTTLIFAELYVHILNTSVLVRWILPLVTRRSIYDLTFWHVFTWSHDDSVSRWCLTTLFPNPKLTIPSDELAQLAVSSVSRRLISAIVDVLLPSNLAWRAQLWLLHFGVWSDAVSLTGVQTCPRSAPPLSCSGRTPCAARPPRSSAPCSRAPGTPLSRWSGSPLTCGRPGSAWQPRCSSSSAASTSRPGGGGQRGTIVRETQDSVVISHTVLARVGACGLHADDSTVWGHLHRLLWVPFFFFMNKWAQILIKCLKWQTARHLCDINNPTAWVEDRRRRKTTI